MVLQKADIERFEWFKKQVSAMGIRFPVAEIAEKTGFDQGNISSYLKGKKPISDNFLTKFKEAYKIGEEIEPSVKQILMILAEAFKSQTVIVQNIEKNMAQRESQARIEISLTEVLTGVERIAIRQDESVQEILAKIGKNPPSKGAGKR